MAGDKALGCYMCKRKFIRICFVCDCNIYIIRNFRNGCIKDGYNIEDEGFYIGGQWVCNACIKLSGLFDPKQKPLNTNYTLYLEEVKNG
ncbi:MAG: hypothetical protein ACTSQH_00110 [Candidatus Hodarchaeales archaeon]